MIENLAFAYYVFDIKIFTFLTACVTKCVIYMFMDNLFLILFQIYLTNETFDHSTLSIVIIAGDVQYIQVNKLA